MSLLKLSTSLLVIVTHLQLLITLLGNLIQRFSLHTKPHNPKQGKQRIVLCIHFLGHLCFKICNKINKLIKSHYPCIKLQFVYKSPKRLSFLFKYKDFFTPLVCSDVIYKCSCSGCNATYYGKAFRNLKIRCYEHFGLNKSGGKRASTSSSSIWDVIKQSGHIGTLEDFSIISKSDNSFDLLIHESLFIQGDRPTLNSQQSTIPMVLFQLFHVLSLLFLYSLLRH